MCQRPHNREQPTDDMDSDGSLPPLHKLTTDPTAVPPPACYRPLHAIDPDDVPGPPCYRPLHAVDPDEEPGPPCYRPLVAVDDEEEFRRPTPDRERSFHQTRDEVAKEEEEPLDKSIGRVERILLGNSAKMGEVTGVANIHACLGLVAAMCEPGGAAEQQLFKFFGIQQFDQLRALKDPSRMMFSILTPLAYKLLETDGGRAAVEKVASLGGEMIPLSALMSVEAVINNKIRAPLDLKKDLFNDGDIYDPSGDENFLLAMVAAERIKVSWMEEFKELGAMDFRKDDGSTARASFCGDMRSLQYMPGGTFSAVGIPAKPENGGSRSMILVLPNDGYTVDQAMAQLAARYATKTAHWYSTQVDLLFPKMDAKYGPASIVDRLAPEVPDIFNAGAQPFNYALPTAKLRELTDDPLATPVYVGKVLHFASFTADHKGAEAKAVTVATFAWRSLSAAEPEVPIPFHCNKPFGVLLVDGPVEGGFAVEFVAKMDETTIVAA